MNKTYIYKWYSSDVFQGVIEPINPFSLQKEINSAGSQMQIDLPVSFSQADAQQEVDLLKTEEDDLVVTEQNISLIVDSAVSIGGFPGLNDTIVVWEYSADYPDGIIKYDGLVSTWSSDYSAANTKITLVNKGIGLDNYIVQTTAGDLLTSNPIANEDGTYTLNPLPDKLPTFNVVKLAQVFSMGTDSDIGKVGVSIGRSHSFDSTVRLSVYKGTPLLPGALLGSVEVDITSTTQELVDFVFSSPVPIIANEDYFVELHNTSTYFASDLDIGIESTGTYAQGESYYSGYTGGYNPSPLTSDMIFYIYAESGGTGRQYLSQDPGFMARDLINSFGSVGGELSYTNDTIETTGTVVSYTFKLSTYLDAIKKCVELAPANWWWSVDSATGVVTFKPLAQEPDHTLTVGKHVKNIVVSSSLEQIDNVIYYSGGDDGTGTNVLVRATDSTSIDRYGNWLAIVSDNRVSLENTAEILSSAILNERKDPRYMTTVNIPSGEYDFNLIKVGQVVSFNGADNILDSFSLQIMSVRETPDELTLVLDILPPTTSKRVEDIRRNLQSEQTRNNPE